MTNVVAQTISPQQEPAQLVFEGGLSMFGVSFFDQSNFKAELSDFI